MEKHADLAAGERRSFLKQMFSFVLIVPSVTAFTGLFQRVMAAGLPAGEKAIDEKSPMAAALKYHADASKSPERKAKGAAAASQSCKGCQFFTASNEGWGKCQLLQGGVVNGGGWCNSFVKRA